MSEDSRFKKRVYVSAVALGLAVGSVGIAAAATGGNADSTAPADDATEIREPAYTGSIQAPAEDESLGETDEATQLEQLATISPDDAGAAASTAVSGDVVKVELDNENTAVVYSVEIADPTGGETEVRVDAGDGTILAQQADDGDDTEVDNDDIEDENEHGGQSENEAADIRDD